MFFSKKKLFCLSLFTGITYFLHSLVWTQSKHPRDTDYINNIVIEIPAEPGTNAEINSENEITFTDLQPFLLSTPKTVMRTSPPQFLTDVKNPCFAMDNHYMNVGNINLSYALKMKYEIRCLPFMYIIGKF